MRNSRPALPLTNTAARIDEPTTNASPLRTIFARSDTCRSGRSVPTRARNEELPQKNPSEAFLSPFPSLPRLLVGDDDTVWFTDHVREMLSGLDSSVPYFFSDNLGGCCPQLGKCVCAKPSPAARLERPTAAPHEDNPLLSRLRTLMSFPAPHSSSPCSDCYDLSDQAIACSLPRKEAAAGGSADANANASVGGVNASGSGDDSGGCSRHPALAPCLASALSDLAVTCPTSFRPWEGMPASEPRGVVWAYGDTGMIISRGMMEAIPVETWLDCEWCRTNPERVSGEQGASRIQHCRERAARRLLSCTPLPRPLPCSCTTPRAPPHMLALMRSSR